MAALLMVAAVLLLGGFTVWVKCLTDYNGDAPACDMRECSSCPFPCENHTAENHTAQLRGDKEK